jgi:undecaprenyl-diphosphatase
MRVLKGQDWKLFGQLIAATIPAVFFGFLLADQIEQLNNNIWVVVVMLVAVGIVMIIAGKPNENADDREIEKSVSWPIALKIGAIQALALIPGTSRSGVTILMGLRNNLSARRAAEFSFLLAIPVLAGGSLKMLTSDKGQALIQNNFGPFLVGNIVAFVSGMLAISFLLKLLGTRGLKDFGWYRIGLGVVLSILLITGII